MSESDPAIVTKPYAAQYDDPIEFEAGALLNVEREDAEHPGWLWCRAPSGKEGWVHCSFVNRAGENATGIAAYSAKELSVVGGESVHIIRWLDGWAYIRLENGVQGWIPQSHVRRSAPLATRLRS
jgi:SH3-like domain-containing protein